MKIRNLEHLKEFLGFYKIDSFSAEIIEEEDGYAIFGIRVSSNELKELLKDQPVSYSISRALVISKTH